MTLSPHPLCGSPLAEGAYIKKIQFIKIKESTYVYENGLALVW